MANENPNAGQPGHAGDPGHQGQGQGQATAPGQNKPTAQPQPASPEELRKNYEAAVAKMTDRHLYDRIMAAHPHAMQSKEATAAMVADYDRLVREQEKADPNRPMGTTG